MKFSRILLALVPIFALTTAAPVVIADNPSSPFYVTEPSQETTFVKGEVIRLSWSNGKPGTLSINVLEGDDPNSMQPTQWAASLQSVSGDSVYSFPATAFFEETKTYCFQLVFQDQDTTYESFSARFKVANPSTEVKRDSTKIGPPYLY
ncbi:hypothetical protein CU097_015288 [Rhizopus azygosporus]|uniref:Yeast cell wall synthesis Kre9/Knh1-like N-terminal domain-containing protein n=1 Tax=Rhizopus azygosporus TaxID=86630 RepID=A0A367KBB0_RHIAZ|nr:hypothetical protein CU097_015288 [Rhizopus azygosporus]